MRKIKASEAIPARPLPKLNPSKTPIRASELVKKRYADAQKALERAIKQREDHIIKLARLHSKIWKLARTVQYYERTAR